MLRALNFSAALLLSTALSQSFWLSAASAHEMQLQDYGMWSYFQFSNDGAPLGSVTRDSWRQIIRRKYVSHDAAGEPIATARQTGLLWGHLFTSNAQMSVTAIDHSYLGRFVGSLWVPYAASFAVYNAAGTKVARVTVDRHAQLVAVRSATDWNSVLGFATRVQQATRGKDSWLISMPPKDVDIDERIWPLVMAYFGDNWGKMALEHTEG